MSKIDSFVGIVGIAAGLLGVGYAVGTHSKMAQISKKLDRSIDELSSQTEIDIPTDMIERAVEKAVAYEVKQIVSKATDEVKRSIKQDIHKKVSDAIEGEYSHIKDSVLEELVTEAAKIDAKRVRADVEKAAKERALAKFDDNLDEVLEDFKGQLNSISRAYRTFADAVTPSTSKETILRIG